MRPVVERMEQAREAIILRRRVPRVFFLSPADYALFAATEPPTVEAMFAIPLGHKPQPVTCLSFRGIAVREAATRKPDRSGRVRSNLFSHCGISAQVPWT